MESSSDNEKIEPKKSTSIYTPEDKMMVRTIMLCEKEYPSWSSLTTQEKIKQISQAAKILTSDSKGIKLSHDIGIISNILKQNTDSSTNNPINLQILSAYTNPHNQAIDDLIEFLHFQETYFYEYSSDPENKANLANQITAILNRPEKNPEMQEDDGTQFQDPSFSQAEAWEIFLNLKETYETYTDEEKIDHVISLMQFDPILEQMQIIDFLKIHTIDFIEEHRIAKQLAAYFDLEHAEVSNDELEDEYGKEEKEEKEEVEEDEEDEYKKGQKEELSDEEREEKRPKRT